MNNVFHVVVPLAQTYFNTAEDFFYAVHVSSCPMMEAVLQKLAKNTNEPNMQQALVMTKSELEKLGAKVDCQMAVCVCSGDRCKHFSHVNQTNVICNSGISLDSPA